MSNEWTVNTLSPLVRTHWAGNLGYQKEIESDWRDVYRIVDKCCRGDSAKFDADISFAVWAFRNDRAQDRRRGSLDDESYGDARRHLKACKGAISALSAVAALGPIFDGETTALTSALRDYCSRIDSIMGQHNGRGRPGEYPIKRLVLTLENRWAQHTGRPCEGTDWFDFVDCVLRAAQYKLIGNVDKLINRAHRAIPEIIAPVADLEFIHPQDDNGAQPLLLYLRSGENAKRFYHIGKKVLFLHRGEIAEADTSIEQMFAVNNC